MNKISDPPQKPVRRSFLYTPFIERYPNDQQAAQYTLWINGCVLILLVLLWPKTDYGFGASVVIGICTILVAVLAGLNLSLRHGLSVKTYRWTWLAYINKVTLAFGGTAGLLFIVLNWWLH